MTQCIGTTFKTILSKIQAYNSTSKCTRTRKNPVFYLACQKTESYHVKPLLILFAECLLNTRSTKFSIVFPTILLFFVLMYVNIVYCNRNSKKLS